MALQNWSEGVVVVDLPGEPRMRDELKTVLEVVRGRGDCDVIMDFSSVDIMTCASISFLLRLRKLLADCGHRLIFFAVTPATKNVFDVVGLDEVFEFAEDESAAVRMLECDEISGSPV